MKLYAKVLALVLALLLAVTAFAACGDETPVETGKKETNAPTEPEDDDPRKAIKDGVPTDLNYNNDTITFFTRNDSEKYEYEMACEDLLNDTLYDAIHYRNIDVETRLGVRIQTISQVGNWGSHTEWNSALSTSVLTNTGDYDATAFYTSGASVLAKDSIFYNILELSTEYGDGYIDFDKPWWNQTMLDELMIYDTMYFAGGDICSTEIQDGIILSFNKDMFDELFPDEGSDSLYQSVRDQKWTIEKIINYVDQCWEDANSNGVIDDGDVVGFRSFATDKSDGRMDAWVYAMGLHLTEKDEFGEPVIALYNTQTVPAYELVKKLHAQTAGSLLLPNGSSTATSFGNGNVLFTKMLISDGAGLRDKLVNFGIIPLPKYDEDQEAYRTCVRNTASMVAVLSNLSEERAKEVSAVFELLAAESYKQVTPKYLSTVVKGIYSKDQVDAEMFDIILGSFDFSFGYVYSTMSLGAIGNIFRCMSDSYDIQKEIDGNRATYELQLKNLLAALEAIS